MPQNHLYILTGASRGMGLAMAQQLLRSGNTLICIARSANDDLAAEARAAGICQRHPHQQRGHDPTH